MSSQLDMSLDEIIRSKGKSERPKGASSSSDGFGPLRSHLSRNPIRMAPYSVPMPMPAVSTMWHQQQVMLAGGSDIETTTKLYISNLDYDVTNEDIMLLFSEIGDMKRYGIHYDRSGRSKGTAEVVFSRRSDAIAAIKRYNNVQLDGKPMKIEIVGIDLAAPLLPLPNYTLGGSPSFYTRGHSHGSGTKGPYPGSTSRGPSRQVKAHFQKPSAKELDDDLDRYHLEAKTHL